MTDHVEIVERVIESRDQHERDFYRLINNTGDKPQKMTTQKNKQQSTTKYNKITDFQHKTQKFQHKTKHCNDNWKTCLTDIYNSTTAISNLS